MAWDVVSKYKLDMTGSGDNTAPLSLLAIDIALLAADNRPLPKLVFSEGICAFSQWPDLAYSRLHMAADGHCILKHIGAGNAVTIDGSLRGVGCWDYQFDGFTVQPGPKSQHSLVLNEVHWSCFRKISAQGAGPPAGAIKFCGVRQNFCVATRFDDYECIVQYRPDTVVSHDCIGMWLDGPIPSRAQVQNNGPTTQAFFTNPNICFCAIGFYLASSNNALVVNGAVQNCTDTGVVIAQGGYNKFMNMDLEENKFDIRTVAGKAHSNKFWRPGNFSGYHVDLAGWNNTIVHDVQDGMFGM